MTLSKKNWPKKGNPPGEAGGIIMNPKRIVTVS
jgi:hypothetical protein